MKKHLLFISFLAIAFASCEGPMGPPGEPGDNFLPYVRYFTVRSSDWQQYDSDEYVHLYKYVVDMDIGDNAYNNGFVNVYLFQSDDGNEVQTQLPLWIQYTVAGNTWLEGYNFDFDRNSVAFYVDYRKGQRPPSCEFRVVVAP